MLFHSTKNLGKNVLIATLKFASLLASVDAPTQQRLIAAMSTTNQTQEGSAAGGTVSQVVTPPGVTAPLGTQISTTTSESVTALTNVKHQEERRTVTASTENEDQEHEGTNTDSVEEERVV